jgi:hypothetical protein
MISRIRVCAAFSALAFGSSPAIALEAGQCLSAAEMQAALKSEGQAPIIVGNRVTTRKDRPVNMFTGDSSGRGYELEGDAPQGTPSKTVCVMSRYHGAKINDITSPKVPTWALIGNDTKAANDHCKATASGLCESYDDYVRRATSAGMRVMMVARIDVGKRGEAPRDGRLLTILTRPDRKIADVKVTNSLGASESVAGLESVNYTQFAGNLIKGN